MKEWKMSLLILLLGLSIPWLMADSGHDGWPKSVLITNDNGIDDVKILELARGFARVTRTIVVAATEDRSGSTNFALAFTSGKLRVTRKDIGYNIEAYAVEGYPADCVLVGMMGILKDNPPDLVVSGINGGPNLAFEWIGSGTIGAARMAAAGVPAIAVSGLDETIPGSVQGVVKWVVDFARSDLVRNLKKYQYLTISIPTIPFNKIKGVKLAKRAGLIVDFIFERDGTEQNIWVMKPVPRNPTNISADSDLFFYRAGYITVVPMKLDEHDYGLYNKIKNNPALLPQWEGT